MARMGDFEQRDWATGRSYLSMGCWQGESRSYRQGTFRSAHGLVEVYEQVGGHPHTSLRFMYKGRDYCRSWRTTWGDKTLARLSREFVSDIVAQD